MVVMAHKCSSAHLEVSPITYGTDLSKGFGGGFRAALPGPVLPLVQGASFKFVDCANRCF